MSPRSQIPEALISTLTQAGSPSPVLAALSRLQFVRLRGAGRDSANEAFGVLPELVRGFLTAQDTLAFLLRSDGDEVFVGVGCADHIRAEAFGHALSAALRGPRPVAIGANFAALSFASVGCLMGMPRPANQSATRPDRGITADLLIDVLRGHPFAFAVFATPAPAEESRRQLDGLRERAETLDRDYLAKPQQADVHRPARSGRDWLDTMIQRMERGLVHGMWRCSVLLATESPELTFQGLGVVSGGLEESPESALLPLRPALCDHDRKEPPVHSNLLESAELASLLLLPRRDRLGFALCDVAPFDVDHPEGLNGIRLGTILDGDRPTRRWFRVPTVNLTRHAFVAGHTGSGKTTMVHQILRELEDIPYLVLEPAKSEYRALAREKADLCVFSVGKLPSADEIPFQLNPFAFPDGFPLHTHIDLLKNAFTASFGFVPPTPYLLESALYRAYELSGWSLETGEHPNGHDPLSFPMLSHLLAVVDPVVEAAGYDSEVSRNLRGALRTRIGNLCLGPKGLALDTRENLPDELLFGRPLVLEFRHLGSDAEKAFLMSLTLTRLYEVRESSGAPSGAEQLRHLLVVEEAHRLLRRQAERPGEEGNMAHEAVRAFENLISEVRAYGQGVVLVDQLPSAISPGALKQTALKLIHRLIPREDREAVSDVLSEAQSRALAFLDTGTAVVHTEGMDGAVRVGVPAPDPARHETPIRPSFVERVRSAIGRDAVERLERARHRAPHARALGNAGVKAVADAVLLSAASGRSLAAPLAQLRELLDRTPSGRASTEEPAAELLVELALEEALLRRAMYYFWDDKRLSGVSRHLRGDAGRLSEALSKELRRETLPNPWCSSCRMWCQLGYEGHRLASRRPFMIAVCSKEESSHERLKSLLEAGRDQMQVILPGADTQVEALTACASGMVLDRLGMDPDEIDSEIRIILERGNGEGR